MKPTKETVAQTLAASQAILDQTQAQGNKAFKGSKFDVPVIAPTPATSTPKITPESLQGATAPVVSPLPTPVVAPKLAADLTVQAEDAFNQKLATDKVAAEAGKTTALQTYLDQIKQTKGLTGLTADAYAAPGGVNAITPELNDINDQIRREELSARRAIENITKQGGQSKAQAQAQINNLNRESIAKRADLSIIQQAVQGRFDSAKENADRAVSAQFEQQQQAIDIAKFDYTENKDIFTKTEQREYDSLFADRQNRIAEAKQNKQSIYDLGIQASADGAPASVVQKMMQARTREEALALGGTYIGALDRQAKQASIRASNLSSQKTQAELNAINSTATGGNNIAVQALDSFSGTLNENNREQYTKALTGAVKRGNVEQTEIALKNAAQAAAGSALREDVIKRDQAIGALKKVEKELQAYEAAGGKTDILSGGYEDLQNKLGKTGNPKLAEIETRINLALNAYTNAVSGASFTPQESARYESLFPSTSKTNQLNTAKISTLLDSFEGNNQVFYGNFYGGYTPSQLAEQSVYEELVANASPEQLKELGITQ